LAIWGHRGVPSSASMGTLSLQITGLTCRCCMHKRIIAITGCNVTIMDIWKIFKYCDLDLTFQGHPRSKVMSPVEPQYVITYITSVLTNSLKWPVNDIEAFLHIVGIFRVPLGTCLLNSGDQLFTTTRYHHQKEVYPKRTADTKRLVENLWNIDIFAIFGYSRAVNRYWIFSFLIIRCERQPR